MSKLIPLTKELMKKMGIVSTQKGFMVNAPKPIKKEKEEKREDPKKSSSQERFQKPQVQQVQIVVKPTKEQVKKNNEDRGIY